MKIISKRELNQQTAQVLAGVRAGQPTLVTEYGVARWRIEAVDAAVDPVARLRAEGRITPAKTQPRAWPAHAAARHYTAAEIDALFADSRGDR
jgi:antitoxin (DNA-binding transcriptional repressor) of toxin-antitoxin stability system